MKNVVRAVIALLLVASLVIYFYPSPPRPDAPTTDGDVTDGTKNISEKNVIQGLKSCEICGYNALETKGSTCANCGYSVTVEAAESENLSSVEEYIIIKQIEYFMPDTLGSSIDFLSPVISEKGYPKNGNWRPRVFETQIFEIQKAMLEADQRKAVTKDSVPTIE